LQGNYKKVEKVKKVQKQKTGAIAVQAVVPVFCFWFVRKLDDALDLLHRLHPVIKVLTCCKMVRFGDCFSVSSPLQ
jgi:hypothetical protein